MKIKLFLSVIFITTACFSDEQATQQSSAEDKFPHVYVGGYGGYGVINGIYQHNEQTPQQSSVEDKLSRVYVGGYGGYGVIDGIYQHDGQYAQYRFALGVDAVLWQHFAFSIESGVQSGNTMRASSNQSLIAQAGGLLPQVILKPFLDLLIGLRWNFTNKFCLLVKAGIAYRQLQLTDRTSAHDSLRKINGELQTGIGYQLTRHARLVTYYQGIYSNAHFKLTLAPNNDLLIHHIPTQQAGLLGIEYTF